MERPETTWKLYTDIIGVQAPWVITEVIKGEKERKITVRIENKPGTTLQCPLYGGQATVYDHRVRVLRYLDTCQYETFLEARVPRVRRVEDGVRQMDILFAEKHSRFTSRFEAVVIVWLQNSPLSAAAKNFRLSRDEADGIRVCRKTLQITNNPGIMHIPG